MNIYFLYNPYLINNSSWIPLLEVLNITCLIDLVSYKTDAKDPPSSNNNVFDSINEKYNLSKILPTNYSTLSQQEKRETYTKKLNSILSNVIEKAKTYINKKPVSPEPHKLVYENLGENILILCNPQPNDKKLINYCARYIHYAIINKRICNIKFVNQFTLKFDKRECEHYYKDNIWEGSMGGAPRMMDSIFREMKEKYNIAIEDFYNETISESVIIFQRKYQEYRDWERNSYNEMEYKRAQEKREEDDRDEWIKACNNN